MWETWFGATMKDGFGVVGELNRRFLMLAFNVGGYEELLGK